MAKLQKSGFNSNPVAMIKKAKDSATPPATHTDPISAVKMHGDKALSASKSVESVPKVKRPSKVRKPQGEKLEKVYTDLEAIMLQGKEHVYAKCKFIDCQEVGCAFCRSLFSNFTLSRCKGHPKCTKSGWYPHLGPKMWAHLTRFHKTNNLFIAKPRELKEDELCAYSVFRGVTNPSINSMTPPHEMETGYDSDGSSSTITSASSSSSTSKRSFNEVDHKDWYVASSMSDRPSKRHASRDKTAKSCK